jgi:hypothetical protein
MKGIFLAVLFVFIATGICLAADPSSISGTYICKSDNKEYITLAADGSFHLKQRKFPPTPDNPFMEVNGKFESSGETITLKLADGGEGTITLKENTIDDGNGKTWVKEGSEPHKQVERPKRIKW